jgi:tetratricopeptide (TPR) repeat protein
LLFLGFQFFFRTAVAETATVDERTVGLEVAERLVRRRLAICENRKDLSGIGRALTNLGLVLHYQRRYSEAEEHYCRAVESDRGCGDVRGLVRSLGNLGNFYETRFVPASEDDLSLAESLYREAIDTAQNAGLSQLAGSPTANLGDLTETRGDRASARRLWQQAVDLTGDSNVKVRTYCQRRLSETR